MQLLLDQRSYNSDKSNLNNYFYNNFVNKI